MNTTQYPIKKYQISNNYKISIIIIAALYALTLAALPIDGFTDRLNYLNYAENSRSIASRYLSTGFLSFMINEPLWLGLNSGLSYYLSPDQVVRTLIAIPSFIVAYCTLRVNNKYFLILLVFIFLPQVIKNHIIHLRQGVGVSIFLLAWFVKRKNLKYMLIMMTPLIHASFFFVVLLLFSNYWMSRLRLHLDLKIIYFAVVGISIGLGLVFIALAFGARQATNYEFIAADVSGLGFLFWAGVLFIFCYEEVRGNKGFSFVIGCIVFYLCTYFLTEVTARIFESTLMLCILAGLSLSQWRKYAFIFAITIYCGLLYFFRIGQPYLGWAG